MELIALTCEVGMPLTLLCYRLNLLKSSSPSYREMTAAATVLPINEWIHAILESIAYSSEPSHFPESPPASVSTSSTLSGFHLFVRPSIGC